MNGMLPNEDVSREIIRRQHREDHEWARAGRLSRLARVTRDQAGHGPRRTRSLAMAMPTVVIAALLAGAGVL